MDYERESAIAVFRTQREPAAPGVLELLPAQTAPRWHAMLGPALILLTLALLVRWTWLRTLDPVIDFGREFYTPWQLSQGHHLYGDVAAFYGPLSQYLNAAAFRYFGPTLQTLIAVNIAVLALGTFLLYNLLRAVAGRLAATTGCLMFLAMFAAAHLGAVGNFNFITPYSHEATHGFVLSLAALCSLAMYVRTAHMRWARAVGFFTGLVFLTKPEIFIALAGAVGIGMLLLVLTRKEDQTPAQVILSVVWWALVPVLAMFGFLATQLPVHEAVRGTCGAWLFMANRTLMHSHFYANSMGLESPKTQAMTVLMTTARFAALLLPALIVGLRLGDSGRWQRTLGIVAGVLSVVCVALLLGPEWWASAGEILLATTILLALWQGGGLLRKRPGAGTHAGQILRLTVVIFALFMLLKMFLNTRFHQYGFVLGVMATMVLVVAILDWVPRFLESHKCSGWTFRAAGLTVLAMLTAVSLMITAPNLLENTQPIGSGANRFLIDGRAAVFNDMIAFIGRNTTDQETLTVLPEGVMLNVLTGRRSAIPYLTTLPSDLTMFSEQQVLAALTKGRPDYIAIMHRTTADQGLPRFGTDYAMKIRNWTMENYVPAHQSGALPFTSDDFGILLLRRKELGPANPVALSPAPR